MILERLTLYLGGVLGLVALGVTSTCVQVAQEQPANWRGSDSPPAAAVAEPSYVQVPAVPRDEIARFHRGLVLGLFPWQDDRPDYFEDFVEMRALGTNTVSLNLNWYMRDVRAPTVFAGVADYWNQTPADEIVLDAMRAAHHAGLRVMLFPSIYVLRLKQGEWRGRITPADGWDVWFESYREQLVHLAQLAQACEVEVLCIGIELITAEPLTDHWRRLIAEVRQVYTGKLLYSSNWDARHDNDWFDDLDYLGMNAYYELSHAQNPTLGELMIGWSRVRADLAEWRARHDKPLIITEIGYQSRDGTIGRPWDYFLQAPVDLEEQRLAYEAFFRSWFHDPALHGVFFYHWFGDGGPADDTYTPRGKPAADVLNAWYAAYDQREDDGDSGADFEPPPRGNLPDDDDSPGVSDGDSHTLPWPFGQLHPSDDDGNNDESTDDDGSGNGDGDGESDTDTSGTGGSGGGSAEHGTADADPRD